MDIKLKTAFNSNNLNINYCNVEELYKLSNPHINYTKKNQYNFKLLSLYGKIKIKPMRILLYVNKYDPLTGDFLRIDLEASIDINDAFLDVLFNYLFKGILVRKKCELYNF
jgi:hypothetical protein